MRLALNIFLLELRKLLTYRADFWVNFIGLTFFTLLIAYYLWSSVFEASGKSSINGFDMNMMIFYYLTVPMIFRIQQGENIGFVSRDIYEGSLNKYLLYPFKIDTFKLASYLAHSFFYTVQLFLIIFIYQMFFATTDIYQFDLVNIFIFLFVIGLNSISYYYLFLIPELSAFWFDNIWSLGVLLRFISSFLGGALIPLALFPQWAQRTLEYTPFPYMIDFPYKVLMGQLSGADILHKLGLTLVWLGVFYLLSRQLWKRGKYQYTGVGI